MTITKLSRPNVNVPSMFLGGTRMLKAAPVPFSCAQYSWPGWASTGGCHTAHLRVIIVSVALKHTKSRKLSSWIKSEPILGVEWARANIACQQTSVVPLSKHRHADRPPLKGMHGWLGGGHLGCATHYSLLTTLYSLLTAQSRARLMERMLWLLVWG